MNLTFRRGAYCLTGAPEVLSTAWTRYPGGAAKTIDPHAAMVFLQCADDETAAKLEGIRKAEQAAMAPSWATDTDFTVPMPEGTALRPYQTAAVAFAMQRKNTLFADVPRLGKSAPALGVANVMEANKIVILTTASAKPQWQRYCLKWLMPAGLDVQIVKGWDDTLRGDVLILNWEILDHYDIRTCDLLIGDECRAIKNPKSKRNKAFFKINAKRTLFLDGTPINTRPIDLWPVVRACDPAALGKSRSDFVMRYCGGGWQDDGSWDVNGASNLEELQRRMRQSFMIRREKRDVVSEMPTTREAVWLPNDSFADLISAERSAILGNSLRSLQEILEGYADGETPESPELENARTELARAKLPQVYAYVDRLLTTTSKVVVFAYHRPITAALAEHYGESVALVRGGVSPKQREAAIHRFQNDPACRVFVGNITACNSAISLAAANDVVYAELSWVPTEMEQSEDRVWLPGKADPLTMHWLMFEDSIDAAMYTILIDRMRDIGKALNREHVT